MDDDIPRVGCGSNDEQLTLQDRRHADLIASMPAFFAVIHDGLGQSHADVIDVEIVDELAQLDAERACWAVDAQSAGHLKLTSLLLASYRVLMRKLPSEEATMLLQKAFVEPWRELTARVRAALDTADDPFLFLSTASKEKEVRTYGPTFTFERERDDADAYLLNIRRCFYHDYFVAHDAAELTRIFCEWDRSWFDAIAPDRHKVRFDRPTTLGYGGDMCRFQFRRVP